MDPRVQRLHAPVEHLGEAGVVAHLLDREARRRAATARCRPRPPARRRARAARARARPARVCPRRRAARAPPGAWWHQGESWTHLLARRGGGKRRSGGDVAEVYRGENARSQIQLARARALRRARATRRRSCPRTPRRLPPAAPPGHPRFRCRTRPQSPRSPRGVADLDPDVVHRHAARDRTARAREPDAPAPRGRDRNPVRIAERERGDPRVGARAVERRIADRFAAAHAPQRDHGCAQAHHGPQRAGSLRRGLCAVEHEARAHRVLRRPVRGELLERDEAPRSSRRARSRARRRGGAVPRSRRANARSCARVGARSGSSARAKCVITPASVSAGIARDAGEKRFRVGERHAHPTHSGIDLDVHGDAAAAAPARRRRERRTARRVVEHRGELARDHLVGLARVAGACEHEQRGHDAGVAQRDGFPDARGRERVASGRHERARHGHRSVTIGVGLHHRDHVPPGGETCRLGVVRAQRIEVDRRDRRSEAPRVSQRPPPLRALGTRPRSVSSPGDDRTRARNRRGHGERRAAPDSRGQLRDGPDRAARARRPPGGRGDRPRGGAARGARRPAAARRRPGRDPRSGRRRMRHARLHARQARLRFAPDHRQRQVQLVRAEPRLRGGERRRDGDGRAAAHELRRTPGQRLLDVIVARALHDPAQHRRLLHRRGRDPHRAPGARAARHRRS